MYIKPNKSESDHASIYFFIIYGIQIYMEIVNHFFFTKKEMRVQQM